MRPWPLTLVLAAGGFGAGAFGALLGLGGGVLIVPMLALGLGLPLREAVGVSLLAVIGTSAASAATYLRRGTANLRLGLTLEVVTVAGAILGGLVAFAVDERFIAAAFGIMLVYVAITMVRRRSEPSADEAPGGRSPDARRPGRRRSRAPSTESGTCPAGLALGGLAGIDLGAPRRRRRHRPRADDAPGHGRAAARLDRDEQPDPRHHRVSERGPLCPA